MTADRVAKWERFFRENYKPEILSLSSQYPEKRSLVVSYKEIDRYDTKLAMNLIDKPTDEFYFAEEAIKNILPPDAKFPIHFRVIELPLKPLSKIEIRELRSKHLGKLVAIEGLIRKATEVRPKLEDAAFKCLRCGHITRVLQEEMTYKEPLECSKEDGGCGRGSATTRFKLLIEEGEEGKSRFIDTQKLEIQESPEGLKGGAQPQRISGYVEDDLTGVLTPGDRVILNGILKNRQRALRGLQGKSTIFDIFLQVNSIEMQEHEFEEIEISEKDEKEIIKLSKDENIYSKLVNSIAPSIHGLSIEKEALVLQLFSGVEKDLPDGTRIRGDIHILLVGDPGTAKSQILRYIKELAPRGIYASGKSTSAAGLTATAVRDEFGEGRWTLEAGALVLADKGIACIDEIDKMTEQDRGSMHEAMEQQCISVAKAGITATLQARCAILAAANPKLGRFEEHEYISQQIDLDPPLLSRFDIIFSLTDKPDEIKDSELAAHILRMHKTGEIMKRKELVGEGYKDDEVKRMIKKIEPEIPPELLRKYIAYSKTRIAPVMDDEVFEILQQYYVKIRKEGSEVGAVASTPRQLEALTRLAEASARVRLSDTVKKEDADRAIKIVEYFLRRIAGAGGKFDIDIIATGIAHSQRERIKTILDIIQELEGKEGASEIDIIERATHMGFDEEKVKEDIARLKSDGHIYEPKGGKRRYRVVI
ncbi:MAG: minichromosome maintenance protein MCM [Candidatus Thermoplasmatota archaeon]